MKKTKSKKTESKTGFAPGDVVMLKSGGPAMTVLTVDSQPGLNVTCVWFPVTQPGTDIDSRAIASSYPSQSGFSEATLVRIKPENGSL